MDKGIQYGAEHSIPTMLISAGIALLMSAETEAKMIAGGVLAALGVVAYGLRGKRLNGSA